MEPQRALATDDGVRAVSRRARAGAYRFARARSATAGSWRKRWQETFVRGVACGGPRFDDESGFPPPLADRAQRSWTTCAPGAVRGALGFGRVGPTGS